MESASPEMAMAGMTMPETAGADSANQQIVPLSAQGMPAHAVLVDMGACEPQSCDQGQALASKTNHSAVAQFETISSVAGFSHMDSLRASFHKARGDIAPLSPVVHSPLSVNLRI